MIHIIGTGIKPVLFFYIDFTPRLNISVFLYNDPHVPG